MAADDFKEPPADFWAAVARVSQERVAIAATPFCQVASGGFEPDEIRRQFEDLLRDEHIAFARQVGHTLER